MCERVCVRVCASVVSLLRLCQYVCVPCVFCLSFLIISFYFTLVSGPKMSNDCWFCLDQPYLFSFALTIVMHRSFASLLIKSIRSQINAKKEFNGDDYDGNNNNNLTTFYNTNTLAHRHSLTHIRANSASQHLFFLWSEILNDWHESMCEFFNFMQKYLRVWVVTVSTPYQTHKNSFITLYRWLLFQYGFARLDTSF